jgi:uncharacterized protein (TIGR00645 family)
MQQKQPARLGPLPTLIFASRWLQLPLYLGLIVAQGVYVWQFGVELVHLVSEVFFHGGQAEKAADVAAGLPSAEVAIMLIVLGLIDVVMISNLLMMVIVGGYETFVSRLRLEGHPDQPEWLSHVNASMLKVKLAMAIIGISSIHLLKTFIAAGTLGLPVCGSAAQIAAAQAAAVAGETVGRMICSPLTETGVLWQTIIHCVFILSAIGIAYTDRLMQHAGKPVPKNGH